MGRERELRELLISVPGLFPGTKGTLSKRTPLQAVLLFGLICTINPNKTVF